MTFLEQELSMRSIYMHNILLIDDDVELCSLLTEYLISDDFAVTAVHSGADALKILNTQAFELIILDVMLPKLNGFEILRLIREQSDLPVLMLTARGEEIDRIVGLEMGADDYLAKPCNPRELSARLKAILRRANKTLETSTNSLSVGDINLDDAKHSVMINNKPIELTLAEYKVLKLLLSHPEQVISKESLCKEALERELDPYDRSIDVHISRLRQKLGPLEDGEPRIKTIRGIGYSYRG